MWSFQRRFLGGYRITSHWKNPNGEHSVCSNHQVGSIIWFMVRWHGYNKGNGHWSFYYSSWTTHSIVSRAHWKVQSKDERKRGLYWPHDEVFFADKGSLRNENKNLLLLLLLLLNKHPRIFPSHHDQANVKRLSSHVYTRTLFTILPSSQQPFIISCFHPFCMYPHSLQLARAVAASSNIIIFQFSCLYSDAIHSLGIARNLWSSCIGIGYENDARGDMHIMHEMAEYTWWVTWCICIPATGILLVLYCSWWCYCWSLMCLMPSS